MMISRRLTGLFLAAGVAFLPVAAAAMQDAQANPTPTETPADTAAPTVVNGVTQSNRHSPPAIAPEGVLNNPEWMIALDLSSGGRVVVQLRPDVAPQHVERFKTLIRQGFYNGLTFHRVIDGFMAQGGDPVGNGTGGSTLPDLPQEFNGLPHVRGALSMARSDSPNSANSQFFIMLLPRLALDRNYTVFGRVVTGMEFVDRIQRGEPPAAPTRIVQASVMADNRPAPSPQQLAPATPAISAPVTVDQLNAPIQPPRGN